MIYSQIASILGLILKAKEGQMKTLLNRLITQALQVVCGLIDELQLELRRPPQSNLGDFALNCGPMAKAVGRPATNIALQIAQALDNQSPIATATATGPFVNLKLEPNALFGAAVQTANARQAAGPKSDRIMVEYVSPNTNKPLHLGHLRNATLGSSLANILEAAGHKVVRACLVNDRGVHICKSMLAWQMFANDATPESTGQKGDHFVGDWYVRYAKEVENDPALEQQTTNMLLQWEQGDPEIMALWTMMNEWVYTGFAQTYARFGYRFDRTYFESELYQLGKDLVQRGLDTGVFQINKDGHTVFPLDPKQFGMSRENDLKFATVLRPDGTSVYMTQDIGTAVRKVEDYGLDRSLYVVGNEQNHHFQVLFAMLKALGFEWADNCYHLSYAMVNLPDGKMKSREGTTVDADNLLDNMTDLATEAIRTRHRDQALTEEEVAKRAKIIALSAIKFYLLRFGAQTTITFDSKKSLAFEGDTGPYCLYAFARAQSIISRATQQGLQTASTYDQLGSPEERALALDLVEIPEVIQRAALSYDPMVVANHTLKIARDFSTFYQRCVVVSDNQSLSTQRLALVQAAANGLEWTLSMLGINVLNAM